MTGFFWASGHLGWGIFVLAIFSGLWLLGSDVVWRLKNITIVRLAALACTGWVVGAALIALGFWWVSG